MNFAQVKASYNKLYIIPPHCKHESIKAVRFRNKKKEIKKDITEATALAIWTLSATKAALTAIVKYQSGMYAIIDKVC